MASSAQALAKKATAAATLRAYKADKTHFADWRAAHGFVAVPAASATVGAYLASLADSHAPTTIRRRLSALGKMHRFNDLAWEPGGTATSRARCKVRCAVRPPVTTRGRSYKRIIADQAY